MVDKKVEIIRADICDVTALLDIKRLAFVSLYDRYQDENSPYLCSEEKLQRYIERPKSYYFKIMCDGVLVGGVFVSRKRLRCHLNEVYILPEYQSKGIAESAVRQAERKYCRWLRWELRVPIDMPNNIKLYTKLGYSDTGERVEINERLTLAVFKK